MSKKLWSNYVIVVAAALSAAGCVTVKSGTVVAPVAPTSSKDDAARKLEFVKVERARAEARFAAGEQVCYTKFFTNNCLDKVREEHRFALANVRAIEIEAQHFQRKTRADERDAALVESDKKFQEEQARLLANPPPPKQEQPAPPPRPPSKVDRVAEHDARLKRIEAQEQADAAKREASVKAFEERKAASAQRLKDVERKKAETAKAAADKALAEKAAAEKAAAAAEKAAAAAKSAAPAK